MEFGSRYEYSRDTVDNKDCEVLILMRDGEEQSRYAIVETEVI